MDDLDTVSTAPTEATDVGQEETNDLDTVSIAPTEATDVGQEETNDGDLDENADDDKAKENDTHNEKKAREDAEEEDGMD